jgi:hypothetical protein
LAEILSFTIGETLNFGTAEHIASWSPPPALAVADWLDAAADGAEQMLDILREVREIPELNWSTKPLAQLLAVARAYLDGEQP